MGTVNLPTLRNYARLYAEGRPSGTNSFISDTDLSSILNLAMAKFYDMLVAAHGHEYYATDTALTMVSGTQQYALPSNFYQLLTAHLEWDAQNFEQLSDTSARERTEYQNWQSWGRWTPKAFRLLGTQIASSQTFELWPVPQLSGTVLRVRYVPAFAPLPDDVTVFDSVNGWEKFIALAAAIDMRVMMGKDSGPQTALYNEELARIESMADKRAANFAPQIIDVHPEFARAEWMGDRRWIGP
jgi:hypothetical protein